MGKRMHLTLTGKIFPALSKFMLTPEKMAAISSALQEYTDWEDLVIIVFLGWAPTTLAHLFYEFFLVNNKKKKQQQSNENESENENATIPFEETYLYLVANLFSQAMRIGLLVFLADCAAICCTALDLEIAAKYDFGDITAIVATTLWAVTKFAHLKSYLICKAVSATPDHLGRAAVMDNILNLVIVGIAMLFLSDMFDIDIGTGLGSLFAIGGMQAVVISMASKDLTEHFLAGIFLQISDKFYEGDLIKLGDGSTGTITKIGWMHTMMRAVDETQIRIPNKQLADVRVTNLSRCKQCRVFTKLYVAFEHIEQIEPLLDGIKQEILTVCGDDLITDGSRPWQVHWMGIESDGRCEIVVNAHFNIPPFGNAFCANKQRVMQAIGRVLIANKISLKKPHQEIHVKDSTTLAK